MVRTTQIFRVTLALFFLSLLLPANAHADEATVGWTQGGEGALDGYTLFAPMRSTTTYLVDMYGREVHSWESTRQPGLSAYLLDNGDLLRPGKVSPTPSINPGGWAGIVEILDWDGNLVWEYEYSDDTVQHHHDVAMLPNGNVLILAWEEKTGAEAIAAGRDPDAVGTVFWPEHIIEVEPTLPSGGTIVWEWHVWDHLIQDFDAAQDNFGVVADHPELIDINFGGPGADWQHANAIDYNAELDQIMISVRAFSEIWVIDHSTTTAEAASHEGGDSGRGGDLLYRWGNPEAYGAGDSSDRTLFGQHDAEWIPEGYPGAGNILIFNNGPGRPGPDYTSIEEIEPPVDGAEYTLVAGEAYGPTETVWTYTAEVETDFFASFISGSQRLSNGNTLICDGPAGTFFEVNDADETVWEYVNPINNQGALTQGEAPFNNNCFRCTRIEPDHPGLEGQTLDPGGTVEELADFGDFDNSGTIDALDRECFQLLFTDACPDTTCDAPLFANALGFNADSDGDGDVDCDDWGAFADVWELAVGTPPASIAACAPFLRGDVDGDGEVRALVDSIALLVWAFAGGDEPGCLDAADANDDDTVFALTDVAYLLAWGFELGPEPPLPGVATCGVELELDSDGLSCASPSSGCAP